MNFQETLDLYQSGELQKMYPDYHIVYDETLNIIGWYKDYALHREDGPAIERANGDKVWYLNNERTTALEVFKQANDEQRKHMLCFYPNEFST
mgnify:CR=1 FL=1